MANLKAKDADSSDKFIKATGQGTDADPLVIEHSDSKVAQLAQNIIAYVQSIDNVLRTNKSIYEKVLNSSDLIQTRNYLDADTSNRRISKIEYSSQISNYKIVETYNYEGSANGYYLISITRNSEQLIELS